MDRAVRWLIPAALVAAGFAVMFLARPLLGWFWAGAVGMGIAGVGVGRFPRRPGVPPGPDRRTRQGGAGGPARAGGRPAPRRGGRGA